jgi:hypothetical protein
VISIGLILLFFVGEGFSPAQVAPKEWVGLVFFPIGVVVGMVVAWRKESWGGGITVVSLFAFYGVTPPVARFREAGFVVFMRPAYCSGVRVSQRTAQDSRLTCASAAPVLGAGQAASRAVLPMALF